MRLISTIILICHVACLAACGPLRIEEVKPWQRDILAQDEMQLDPDAMISFTDDHIYFSKEGSMGGKGVGGGGCGCN